MLPKFKGIPPFADGYGVSTREVAPAEAPNPHLEQIGQTSLPGGCSVRRSHSNSLTPAAPTMGHTGDSGSGAWKVAGTVRSIVVNVLAFSIAFLLVGNLFILAATSWAKRSAEPAAIAAPEG